MEKCLIMKCENERQTRGLCPRCYAIARTMMANLETTEEELVKKGMMSPRRTPKENFFREQFKTNY